MNVEDVRVAVDQQRTFFTTRLLLEHPPHVGEGSRVRARVAQLRHDRRVERRLQELVDLQLSGKHAFLGLGKEVLGEVVPQERDLHLGFLAGVDLKVFLGDELLARGDRHGRHEFEELLRVRWLGGNDVQFPGQEAHERVFPADFVDACLDLPEGEIAVFHGELLPSCVPVASRFPRVEGHMTVPPQRGASPTYKMGRFSLWRTLIPYQRTYF